MNKDRRKQIAAVILDVDSILGDEQAAFDSMPGSQQAGDRGIAMEEAIGALEEAVEALQRAMT